MVLSVPSGNCSRNSLVCTPEYAALAAFDIPAGPKVNVVLQDLISQAAVLLLWASMICGAINAVANRRN